MKRRLIFALILIGFSAMAGEIVLMRQLMVVFYGNELSLGITLFGWLFWAALGSWGIGRWIVGRIKQKLIILGLCEMALAFLLPLSLLAARLVPLYFDYSAGEIIGVLPMSIASLLLLAPICILWGFLFVLGCEAYKSNSGASQIGHVYVLEAIGASIGGLITSLLLIRLLSPLHIMFLIGLLNLFAAFWLLRERKVPAISTGVLIVLFLFLIFSGRVDLLRQRSLNLQWSNHKLLASEDSVYGNIAVTRRENLFSIFNNGLYSFTVPDKSTSERMAHFPLLEHPNPKRVLLIGGGSSGQLAEVLKHPLERVDYVELDPLLIELAGEYLPLNEALIDPRVNIIPNMDGRLFIKRTSQSYDVVIVNLPPPHTAQLNRFYTKEFYEEVKDVLNRKGILSFSIYSNPNYISQEQRQLYLILKKTLESVFPEVKITPGETNFFFASKEKGILTLDWRVLMKRSRERDIHARYMREYYLYSELSRERINSFEERLAQSETTTINRDFRPIAYYYDLVLWNTYFKYNLKKLFRAINPKGIYLGAIFLYLILLWPLWLKGLGKKVPNWGVLTCIGTTGFAEITFQIVTLLSFQVIYGYVYYKLGIILTSYMIGLIFGGWYITKMIEKGKGDHSLFIKTQQAVFIYPLILPLLFQIFLSLKGKFSFWLGSNLVLVLIPVIPGLIGGFQFPLANKLYLKRSRRKVGHSAGLTYGLDLFGACFGAVLTTVFLVPVIGIPMTCVLVAGLNLIGLTLLTKMRPLL